MINQQQASDSAMEQVNIYEAKTHFSKYIEKAESGQDVIIARGGKKVVRLTAITPERPQIRYGLLAGKIHVPDDFDQPLPDAALNEFESGSL